LVTQKNDAGLNFTIEKTDVVGLGRKAWKASFAKVKSNIKAISNRGWGPRALNYNVLLHPKILTSKPGAKIQGLLSEMISSAAPEEVNLSDGLAAMLVDRIVLYKNKEALNGVGAYEQRQKRKAIAEERLRSHDKRISAGLLASAGHFYLGTDVRNYVQQRVDAAKEKKYNAHLRRKDNYDILLAKVQELRDQNLPLDKRNAAQLKTMVKWYKRDGDDKIPSKKQDLMAPLRPCSTCAASWLAIDHYPTYVISLGA
jgi:hypothetical protein